MEVYHVLLILRDCYHLQSKMCLVPLLFSHPSVVSSWIIHLSAPLVSISFSPSHCCGYSYPWPNAILTSFQQFGAVFVPQPCVSESGQPHTLGGPGDAGWHWPGGQGKCCLCHQCHQSSIGWSKGRPLCSWRKLKQCSLCPSLAPLKLLSF